MGFKVLKVIGFLFLAIGMLMILLLPVIVMSAPDIHEWVTPGVVLWLLGFVLVFSGFKLATFSNDRLYKIERARRWQPFFDRFG